MWARAPNSHNSERVSDPARFSWNRDWVSVSQAWSHWPATSPEVKSDIRVTKLCFYINCRTNVSYWKTEWVASRLWLRRRMLLVTEVVMVILVKRSHLPAVFSWPGASIKNVNKIKNAVTASSRHTTRSLLYQNIKKVSHVQLVLLQECHSFILTSRVWSSVQVSAYQPVIMTVWTGPRDTTPQCTNYTCPSGAEWTPETANRNVQSPAGVGPLTHVQCLTFTERS